MAVVRQWLDQPTLSADEERGLSGLVRAFQADAGLQRAVAAALTRPTKVPAGRRAALLEVLAESDLPKPPAEWVAAVADAIGQPEPAVRAEAVRAAGVWQVPELDEPLARLADDPTAPAELRVEAIRALVARHPRPSDGRFALLVGQLADTVPPLARLAAADVLGRSALTDAQRQQFLRAVRDDVLVSPDGRAAGVPQGRGHGRRGRPARLPHGRRRPGVEADRRGAGGGAEAAPGRDQGRRPAGRAEEGGRPGPGPPRRVRAAARPAATRTAAGRCSSGRRRRAGRATGSATRAGRSAPT